MALTIRRAVPLATLTTLGLGGPARVLAEIRHVEDAREALRAARSEGAAWGILGGGSNVIAADPDAAGWGFDGWLLHPVGSAMTVVRRDADHVWLRADAGVVWDALVAFAVDEGWAGITCLSGIPGKVGAAPIQNIGAYGQELAAAFDTAEVLDTVTDQVATWSATDCAFQYRDSRLKRAAGRYLVLSVTLRLQIGGAPALRYGELRDRLGLARDPAPESAAASLDVTQPDATRPDATRPDAQPRLATVRETVLAIRRAKGMVLDAADPDSRSAGSFFMNPIVPTTAADGALSGLERRHGATLAMPRYPAPPAVDGTARVKLSAAWLIDRSGLRPGYDHPDHGGRRVGLSAKHTLALVNRGGASTADLLAFAAHVRERVRDTTGIVLMREPVLLQPAR